MAEHESNEFGENFGTIDTTIRAIEPERLELSPATKDYLNSLGEEIEEIYKWISSPSFLKLFQEVRDLQDLGFEYPFFQKKVELYSMFSQELLPKLIEIRKKRVLPPGVEIVIINKVLNANFNLKRPKKFKRFKNPTLTEDHEATTKSPNIEYPIDEFTKDIKISEIPEKLQQSLSVFRNADNNREVDIYNSFRVDIWIEKISKARIVIQQTLKEI